MNQNILIRLEKQAEKLVLDIPASLDCDEYTPLFNEKFAELIIRKCMDLLEDYTTDIHVGGIQYNVVGASETLQEYFGLED